nr:helix-turn-helix domain-containing protein [Calditrichia bacterium]NIW79822.1 helix-turn-helix domain-containing protein [Calditrichia bacterium]
MTIAPSTNKMSNFDRIIWDRLKEYAESQGMSKQRQLAEAIGVHSHHLSGIKNGRKRFGPILIRRICEKLEVSQEWLLSKGENNAEKSAQTERSKDMKELLDQWKQLAHHWKAQYEELKERYDELANTRP